MQNVECKYELRDPALARSICRAIGARLVGTLRQTDTYFRVADGRLKRREVPGEPPEWIFYHRHNRLKPKLSHFTIYSEQEAKARYGERPMPVWLIVEKTRDVWMYDSARLHLDSVTGLGNFFEIEALVTPGKHVGRCHRLIAELLERFRPVLGEPIATSYSDMMALEQEGVEKKG